MGCNKERWKRREEGRKEGLNSVFFALNPRLNVFIAFKKAREGLFLLPFAQN